MKEQDKAKEHAINEVMSFVGQGSKFQAIESESKRLREYLVKLGECLLGLGNDPDHNINSLVGLCGEFMGATCALYNRLEEEMLCSVGKWCTPADYKSIDKPEGHICYDVIMRANEDPFIVSDLQHSLYAKTDPNVIPYKLQTYVGLKVKFNNSSIGSLCVVFQKDFTPTAEEVKFMRIVASAIAAEENHRQTQLKLKETKERDKLICETVTDYVFTVQIKDGKPIQTNHGPTCVAVTGYTPEEFTAAPDLWIKMVHEEDRALVRKHASLILSGKRVNPFEHRIIRKDGAVRWVKNTTVLHFDKEGRLFSYTGLIQDITERKNTDDLLYTSEEKYRTLVENLPASTYIASLDEASPTLYVSPQIKSILSFSPQEIIEDPDFRYKHIYPDDRERVLEELERSHATGEPFHYEYRMLDRDGHIVWIYDTATVMRDIHGKPFCMHGVMFDITKRKQIEEELKKKQQEFQVILDSVPALIFYKDTENRMVHINKTFAEAMGLNREEIEEKTCFELWPPQQAEHFWCDDKEVMESGQPKIGIIEPMMTVKGEIWVETDKIPYRNEEGEIIGIIGFAIDITERKRAQDALATSEEEYRTLVYNVNIGVYRNTLDPDGRFIKANPAIVKMFGYDSVEEFLKIKVAQLYQDPQDRVRLVEKLKKLGFVKDEELRLRKKDGSFMWASLNARVNLDSNEKPQWIDGVIEDISERKKSEENLRLLNKELIKSNKRLKQLALRDPHTGLYNHRYLQDVIEAEFYRAKRYVHPFAVMMLDVDYFKSINDVYGHLFGDLVLKQLARQLKRMVRQYDIVVRFGGEEFMIISPGIDRSQGLKLAERLLDAINLYNFGDKNHMVKLKLSIAVASYPEDKVVKGMDLVEITDQILNKLKEFGGNNVYSSLDIKKKKKSLARKSKIDISFLRGKIEKLNKRTNESLIEAVFAFAKTIELKDQYTGEHVEKTVQYATEIARALNLQGEEIGRIKQAAILHDLGKIGISEKILNKRSKLTKEEFEEIKKHPQIGVDIIRPIKFLHNIIPIMLYHHERWDGRGYPNGLKGDEIPIGARVVAIADVYQALTSNRPYRKAYQEEEALKIIKKGSGTQFDPMVVTKFLQIIKQRKDIK